MKISDIANCIKKRKIGAIGGRRYFSVIILLVERRDGMHVLFEQRSRRMKTQPGDVCFPGGKMEEGETPAQCALRETWEEIGIGAGEVTLLGQFDTLHEISNITMYTFVGKIQEEALKHLRLNEAEVEQVFTVPWEFFVNNPPQIYESQIVQKVDAFPYEETGIRPDYKWRTGKNPIPIYQYDLRPEDTPARAGGESVSRQIIWGLTGRIIWWFVESMESMEDAAKF